jgi:hypothetical protein
MLTVELVYSPNCPHVTEARGQLLRAFAGTGLPAQWQEWVHGAPDSPAYVCTYGSPTIVVSGQDVAGISPSAGGEACRLYEDGEGQFRGVPSVEAITAALLRVKEAAAFTSGETAKARSRWRNSLTVLPALGTALLPKLGCPACWPAYAGLLSALGFGFVNYTPYLLPLTALFLIVAVGSLAYGAKNRRGYGLFILGILSAMTMVIGKFVLESDSIMYGGIALLVAASLWNSWSQRKTQSGSCAACVSAGPVTQTGNADHT